MSYRIPEKPGYLGATDNSPIVFAIIAIPISSWVITQVIAAHFHYHPELGPAIQRLGPMRIYQPFAWMVWAINFFRHPNPDVAHTVRMGAVAGVTAILGACLLAGRRNLHRAKKWGENLEDLRGSSRWATKQEIEKTGLLNAASGVYVGGWYDEQEGRLNYLRHNCPDHVLSFAPTRSGKGVGFVIPTLLAWEESAVIYDIKGENWDKTAGFRAQSGHLCFRFDPLAETGGSRFNPLAEIRLHTLRDVSDSHKLAEILVWSDAPSAHENPYWSKAAESIITGLILHVCYAADAKGRVGSLAELAELFTAPESFTQDQKNQSFVKTLKSLLTYEHDPSGRNGWKTHPTVRRKAIEMLNKLEGPADFGGVLSTATTALNVFCDPLVVRNTSESDFRVTDLVNHDKPVSLYIVIPASDKLRLRSLVRMVFTVVVNRLSERLEKRKHQLLFLIDEFPTLGKMELFADALSYMAGFGMKAYLICQDTVQITEKYGQYQSIMSNCGLTAALTPNNFQTAELLSKMLGDQTIERVAVTYSGDRHSSSPKTVSTSLVPEKRPLLSPSEVQRDLRMPQMDEKSERIVAPGEMLIFKSGHFPIRGTQMLYFQDPVLLARSEIPAPQNRISILPDGSIVPQAPLKLGLVIPIDTKTIEKKANDESPKNNKVPADDGYLYI